MATGQKLITIYRGNARTIRVTVYETSALGVRAIRDVSGDTFKFTVKTPDLLTTEISKSTGAGITFLTDGTDGIILIALDRSDTTVLTSDTVAYKYDVEITETASGDPWTAMAGDLHVLEPVTTPV